MPKRFTLKINLGPVMWMILAAAFFALMGALVKELRRLPTWEVVFFRSLVNFLLYLPWFFLNKPTALLKLAKTEWIPLLSRGVSGCLSMALYFYAIEHMGLANAVMLNNSSPILVLILSAWLLNEKLNLKSVLFVLLAFGGVALVLKPDQSIFDYRHNLAPLAGLVSAFVAAIAYISIKMATRSISANFIVFTFAGVSSAISFIPMVLSYQSMDRFEGLLLLGCGILATLAQTAMTRGYVKLPASVASPMLLLTVVFAACLGWFFWNELPDHWAILGSILIAIGLTGAHRFRATFQQPQTQNA